ncbi:cAMP-dependent protein kinase [Tieghemostelium lacteum]|uniref:cAMP-dependent protein kinase n=1 Tax=Tieghemostelium lacteum TaxID=361077 RepID=A0A152A6Y9_TIELA|nr:cAMP-dependent protein kinase [Tieghemostelium lacteum]|eukprot:KYR01976.1 cAMP-dependent protein kinase [Tieghemostelium lacteum]
MQLLNTHNVKKDYTGLGQFKGYKTEFPQCFNGVFQPHEYVDIILQYNSVFNRPISRAILLTTFLIVFGMIIMLIGTAKSNPQLVMVGAFVCLGISVLVFGLVIIHYRRIEKHFTHLTAHLNQIYFSRGIQFSTTKKFLSLKGKKLRYKLEITYPGMYTQPQQIQPVYVQGMQYVPVQQQPQQQQMYTQQPYIPVAVQQQLRSNTADFNISIDQNDISTPLLNKQQS